MRSLQNGCREKEGSEILLPELQHYRLGDPPSQKGKVPSMQKFQTAILVTILLAAALLIWDKYSYDKDMDEHQKNEMSRQFKNAGEIK